MNTIDKKRRDALYSLLESNTGKYIQQAEIASALSEYYSEASAKRIISADIQQINSNKSYSKIIVSGTKGIKLCHAEEASAFISDRWKELLSKLNKISKLYA